VVCVWCLSGMVSFCCVYCYLHKLDESSNVFCSLSNKLINVIICKNHEIKMKTVDSCSLHIFSIHHDQQQLYNKKKIHTARHRGRHQNYIHHFILYTKWNHRFMQNISGGNISTENNLLKSYSTAVDEWRHGGLFFDSWCIWNVVGRATTR